MESHVREALRSLQTSGGYHPCDGLRGLAMLWVIVFHTTSHMLYEGGIMGRKMFNHWWSVAVAMSGDAAVDLFLVLSGFLLGTALLREITVQRTEEDDSSSDSSGDGAPRAARSKPMSPMAMVKFYIRRWFRIAPAYISAIIFSTIFDFPVTSGKACPRFWWCNMLFINNYYPKWDPLFGENCMVHSWSVAVECQLYFISPPLFAFAACLSSAIPRISPTMAVSLLCGVLFVICCALRIRWMLYESNGAYNPPYVFTEFRMSSYVCGVAGAMAVIELTARPKTARTCLRAFSTTVCSMLAYVVIALSCFFGCEPAYLVYNSELGSQYAKHLPTLAFLHASLLRPLFGAASSYLLVRAVTDRAPLLSKFLSMQCWRPWAGLSYSMYLLQYLGWKILFLPLMGAHVGTEATPIWLGALTTCLGSALTVIGTLPLALLNYVFVERTGMIVGKRVMAWVSRAKVRARDVLPHRLSTKLQQRDKVKKKPSKKADSVGATSTDRFALEFTRQVSEATWQSVWVELEAHANQEIGEDTPDNSPEAQYRPQATTGDTSDEDGA